MKKWIMVKLGLLNAYERIVVLELKVEQMKKSLDGLKLETDILSVFVKKSLDDI